MFIKLPSLTTLYFTLLTFMGKDKKKKKTSTMGKKFTIKKHRVEENNLEIGFSIYKLYFVKETIDYIFHS